jgi:hypothetical protein
MAGGESRAPGTAVGAFGAWWEWPQRTHASRAHPLRGSVHCRVQRGRCGVEPEFKVPRYPTQPLSGCGALAYTTRAQCMRVWGSRQQRERRKRKIADFLPKKRMFALV